MICNYYNHVHQIWQSVRTPMNARRKIRVGRLEREEVLPLVRRY